MVCLALRVLLLVLVPASPPFGRPCPLCESGPQVRCEVLAGSTEAAEEWLAANYLHGQFPSPFGPVCKPPHKMVAVRVPVRLQLRGGCVGALGAGAGGDSMVAVLGMGGSSTQLSFVEGQIEEPLGAAAIEGAPLFRRRRRCPACRKALPLLATRLPAES